MILTFVGVVGVFGFYAWATLQQTPAASSIANAPMLDNTPGGANQAQSPQFQESLERSNDQSAERALQSGSTFIVTPEGILQQSDPVLPEMSQPFEVNEIEVQRPIVTAMPAPVVPQVVRPAPVALPPADPVDAPAPVKPAEPVENPYTKGILRQMTQVASAWNAPQSADRRITLEEEGEKSSPAPSADTPATSDQADAGDEVLIRPGTMLYGETLTTSTSDNAAPVLVEVTTGEFKGARLVGRYTVNPATERMVVQFSSLSLIDGRSVDVSAYAVDGRTAETAVASDVDQRYLQRYGPVFAAAFVSGFGQALGRPASTQSQDGIAFDSATLEQGVFAGVSSAATTIVDDIYANSPKGPLITLRAGYPVAILFVAPVAR
jgi:intracellular multiplication protein IcmE